MSLRSRIALYTFVYLLIGPHQFLATANSYSGLFSWDKYEEEIVSLIEPIDPIAVKEPVGINFTCPSIDLSNIRNGSEPLSVHQLTPNDIDVVAAMGDSLTAGFCAGASSLLNCNWEFRGRSGSIGGDEEVEKCGTLPNILKKYNPSLHGASTGIEKPNSPLYRGRGLNVAVSGSVALDMPEQARDLVESMNLPASGVNVTNDWKVVTLFIGGNDICRYCVVDHSFFEASAHTVENFTIGIRDALDILFDESPRTLVNLVLVLDVAQIAEVHGLKCDPLHWIGCPCCSLGNVQLARERLALYHEVVWDLVASGRYDQPNRTDFTVVIQPFFHSSKIPRNDEGQLDKSYFAPDCFHLDSKSHSAAAMSLWKNMFEPVGNKSLEWIPGEELFCPSEENPYIYTNKNSDEVNLEVGQTPWPDVSDQEPVDQPVWDVLVDLMELAFFCLEDDDVYDPYYRDRAREILDQLIPEFLRDDLEYSMDNETSLDWTCADLKPRPASQEPTYNFNCPIVASSPTVPKSVHELKPGDIKVIAALGDSLTAASGAMADYVPGSLIAFRGVSYSIGGDNTIESVVTLPNFFKKYNPGLKGYSIKAGPAVTLETSRMNVAVFGHTSQDMLGQAKELVKRMRADETINFEEDWKVVTIFIGGNDLCGWCESAEKEELFSPESFIEAMEKALDYLYEELPRAFINLLQVVDVTLLSSVRSIKCDVLHLLLCRCGSFEAPLGNKTRTKELLQAYRIGISELIDSGKYDSKDDFTVVIQPFVSDSSFPIKDGEPDKTFFAPDCFHFGRYGHKESAEALWNNMLEPVGRKRTNWKLGDEYACPNEKTLLYTKKNSLNLPPTDVAPPDCGAVSSKGNLSTDAVIGLSVGCAFGGFLLGLLLGIMAKTGQKKVPVGLENDNHGLEMYPEKTPETTNGLARDSEGTKM